MKKVLMVPDWRNGNPYLELLASSLKGVEVNFGNFSSGLFPLNKMASKNPNSDIFHLHWINELIAPAVWASTDTKKFFRRALIAMDLLLLRARGRRIVWTIHNYVGHETTHESSELKARSIMARFVSHSIVHSPSALRRVRQGYGLKGLTDDRVSVIRHGNYDGCYPLDLANVDALKQRFSLAEEQTVILFLGAVRPYKGLERLIRSFSKSQRSDLRLVIAGKPNSDEYRADLEKMAAADLRISLNFGFIPESEISAFYAIAHVVVIPFERTLTSGSAVLAMTFGRAMILPEHARELDLTGDSGAFYFSDEENLKTIIDGLNADSLKEMGRVNRNTAEDYAWQLVAKQTLQAYGQPQ